jgi:uncharacterized protein YndB with AHSA1/START domain
MVGASGAPTVIAGEYVDVDPPHRLSFTWRFMADVAAILEEPALLLD